MSAIGSKGRTTSPAVNVRLGAKSKQTVFGFNASLVRLLGLAEYQRVGLDFDETSKTFTFTPTNDEQHDGAGTYALGLDGGAAKTRAKGSERRAVHVRRSATESATPGTYLVVKLDAPRFAIVMEGGHAVEMTEEAPPEAPKRPKKPSSKKSKRREARA